MSVERFTTHWYAVWRRCQARSSARLTAWPPARALPALGCDIVLAARSAKFVMAFSKLGWCRTAAAAGSCAVAGRARAMGLALLGDSLSAEQAAQGDYLATGG
ncbi:hypothetical protein KPZU09_17720 [Klebsiella pneumoniae]|uniref:Uncharacterized protein n=1 Tax=Klebsiella pneumoniae TaxID=573 RepID=A0A919HXU3_KLEPN|nr:hypothetical protein KPZU09_17720 [Klebsiella pneumoniae]